MVMIAENNYYDEKYYEMQKECGEYSGVIDIFKFKDDVGRVDRLLDFGCGGGFILERLHAKEKIGIEANEAAARGARERGIKVVASLDDVDDNWADVVISHHALEHVDRPLDVVVTMLAKLKPGGKIVLVTPNETVSMQFREDDPNFHLFTWSPANLGNLLKRAGFTRISAKPVYHRWPPYWYILKRVLGPGVMHVLCVIRGRLQTHYCQVKAIAYKPMADEAPPSGGTRTA